MKNKSNEKKSKQLGMSYSTAYNQLKKKLLFRLVQKLKDDVCFRCGSIIETIEEFSIEHKNAWLDNSSDLFWDLDNISFSHLSCNIRASRNPHKIIPPEGFKWCRTCKTFKALKAFCVAYTQRDASLECRSCKTIYMRKRRGNRKY